MSDKEMIEYIKNNCDKQITDYDSCPLWLCVQFRNEHCGIIFMKYKENRRGNCVRPFTPEEQKENLVKRCNELNKFWGDKANGF